MTQDEIIEMARQAGFWKDLFVYPEFKEHVEAFAKLVEERTAAKEREDLCKYFQELEDKATSVRDKMYLSGVQFAIRARGEA